MLENKVFKIVVICFLSSNLAYGVSFALFNKAQQEHSLVLDNQNKKLNVKLALLQDIYMSSSQQIFSINKHIQLIHLDYVLESLTMESDK